MADSTAGSNFSGIGGVTRSYPIRPVDPSNKDRPSSGERRRKPPKPKLTDDEESAAKPSKQPPADSGHGKIDEYI